MTHREFREWLRRIEGTYSVLEWRVGGIRVWPMIRLVIYGANFHARTAAYSIGAGAGARGYARILIEAMAGWVHARVLDAPRNRRPGGPADAVFLSYSVGRQPELEGRRFNPLLAPYVELLAKRGLHAGVLETSAFGDYNIPRYTPSALIQPWLLWYRIMSQLRRDIRFPESLERYEEFVAEVKSAGFDFPFRRRQALHRDVWFIRRLADRYKSWLSHARPRIGFTADASNREQAFCLACRELGIVSVEIQHGVQGEMHPIYASWFAVPEEGFELRPRVFWSWDEASAAAINEWAQVLSPRAHLAIAGGDPWREMWLEGTSDIAKRARADVAARVREVGGERHVLVTLSSNREILPESVVQAVRRSPSDWRWWFRMHPVNQRPRRAETRRLLADLGQDPERMEFATVVPLYALLPQMDAHVTVGLSTVVQEAAAVGVPSVGCMAEGEDFYAGEIAQGLMRVALDADAMMLALKAALVGKRPVPGGPRPDPDDAMARLLALGPFRLREGAEAA